MGKEAVEIFKLFYSRGNPNGEYILFFFFYFGVLSPYTSSTSFKGKNEGPTRNIIYDKKCIKLHKKTKYMINKYMYK
jgi:hypothetical protein